jgi:methyl-galactoside transport system ATP-binding protein/inositol transport system ATP-binding protein
MSDNHDTEKYLLEMTGIKKEFPGVKALQGVELKIRYGEVHALVGENGAGKSTMMNCLMGIFPPNGGKIVFEGKEISHYTPADALKFGFSMIEQELSPVMERSIMANVWLGREPLNKLGLINWKKMYEDTKEVLKIIDLDEDPRQPMKTLTVAKLQMVEIARAVSYNSKLIIMDEPSSALTEKETQQLFDVIRKLKADGKSVIYISHKLDEIKQITDRISIFRDGMYIGTEDTDKVSQDRIIEMMVGRTISDIFPKVKSEIGKEMLQVEGLSHTGKFQNISFSVRKGEIFGILGLVGAGRTELVETIFGIRKRSTGKIFFKGEEVYFRDGRDAINNGLAFITEDRRGNGLFSVQDIRFNMTSANIYDYVGLFTFINKPRMIRDCVDYIESLQIKTPSLQQQVKNLSGGNQQKVLVARWLLSKPDLIILDEPTRGIDVGSKSEIHKLISSLAVSGKCVIMISSEMPEIMGMSDRIMIMHEGEITGIVNNDKSLSQEILLEYASGIRNTYITDYTVTARGIK